MGLMQRSLLVKLGERRPLRRSRGRLGRHPSRCRREPLLPRLSPSSPLEHAAESLPPARTAAAGLFSLVFFPCASSSPSSATASELEDGHSAAATGRFQHSRAWIWRPQRRIQCLHGWSSPVNTAPARRTEVSDRRSPRADGSVEIGSDVPEAGSSSPLVGPR
jgi:hypothetical protein